jgi:outer membrane PBP1 activator LpoA protein
MTSARENAEKSLREEISSLKDDNRRAIEALEKELALAREDFSTHLSAVEAAVAKVEVSQQVRLWRAKSERCVAY